MKRLLMTLAVSLGMTGAASAAVVNINATVDLTTGLTTSGGGTGFRMNGIGITPVSVTGGDTINLNVSFAGNQRLLLQRTSSGNGLFILGTPISITHMGGSSGTASFADASPAPSFRTAFNSTGLSLFHSSIFSSTAFSITGFISQVTMASNATTRTISGLIVGGDNGVTASIAPATAVPVPAGLPLLLGALGVGGLIARRRRAAGG